MQGYIAQPNKEKLEKEKELKIRELKEKLEKLEAQIKELRNKTEKLNTRNLETNQFTNNFGKITIKFYNVKHEKHK